MGFLFPLILALGLHLAAGSEAAGPCRAWLGLALLAVPYAVAALLTRARIKGRFRMAEALVRLLHLSGVGAYGALLFACGWLDCVRAWTGAELSFLAWPEPSLALSFGPFVVYQLAVIDAEVRGIEPRPAVRRRLRAFQVRMLAATLAPLAAYFALTMLIGTSEVVRLNVQYVGLAEAGFVAVMGALLALSLPTLLRNTWETEALPAGLQRDVCIAVAERADFRARDVLVWRTGHLMANAAIIGLGARRRVVLFSDSLLALLSLRELAAVYGHEIGHAKRHHVLIFLAWALVFLLGGDLAAQAAFPDDEWGGLAVIGASLVVGYFTFGWLSRRFELEADLYSYELLHDPEAMMSALERVGGRLRDVASWRHFSVNDRVAFMHRVATDEGHGPRFRRGLRRWALLGAALALLVIGVQVARLAEDWPEDRAVVELARGRYTEAYERLAGREDVDPDLVMLARAGTDLEATRGARLERADLESVLVGALEAGALDEALAASQLAFYRGSAEQLAVARTLEAALRGEEAEARAELAEVEGRWRGLLAPLVGSRSAQ